MMYLRRKGAIVVLLVLAHLTQAGYGWCGQQEVEEQSNPSVKAVLTGPDGMVVPGAVLLLVPREALEQGALNIKGSLCTTDRFGVGIFRPVEPGEYSVLRLGGGANPGPELLLASTWLGPEADRWEEGLGLSTRLSTLIIEIPDGFALSNGGVRRDKLRQQWEGATQDGEVRLLVQDTRFLFQEGVVEILGQQSAGGAIGDRQIVLPRSRPYLVALDSNHYAMTVEAGVEYRLLSEIGSDGFFEGAIVSKGGLVEFSFDQPAGKPREFVDFDLKIDVSHSLQGHIQVNVDVLDLRGVLIQRRRIFLGEKTLAAARGGAIGNWGFTLPEGDYKAIISDGQDGNPLPGSAIAPSASVFRVHDGMDDLVLNASLAHVLSLSCNATDVALTRDMETLSLRYPSWFLWDKSGQSHLRPEGAWLRKAVDGGFFPDLGPQYELLVFSEDGADLSALVHYSAIARRPEFRGMSTMPPTSQFLYSLVNGWRLWEHSNAQSATAIAIPAGKSIVELGRLRGLKNVRLILGQEGKVTEYLIDSAYNVRPVASEGD